MPEISIIYLYDIQIRFLLFPKLKVRRSYLADMYNVY